MRKLRDELHDYFRSIAPCGECGSRLPIAKIRARLAMIEVWVECGACGAYIEPIPQHILDREVVGVRDECVS